MLKFVPVQIGVSLFCLYKILHEAVFPGSYLICYPQIIQSLNQEFQTNIRTVAKRQQNSYLVPVGHIFCVN